MKLNKPKGVQQWRSWNIRAPTMATRTPIASPDLALQEEFCLSPEQAETIIVEQPGKKWKSALYAAASRPPRYPKLSPNWTIPAQPTFVYWFSFIRMSSFISLGGRLMEKKTPLVLTRFLLITVSLLLRRNHNGPSFRFDSI